MPCKLFPRTTPVEKYWFHDIDDKGNMCPNSDKITVVLERLALIVKNNYTLRDNLKLIEG